MILYHLLTKFITFVIIVSLFLSFSCVCPFSTNSVHVLLLHQADNLRKLKMSMCENVYLQMKSEEKRLQSYHNKPTAEMSPNELAKAGFFYLRENCVQCAFCRGLVCNLSKEEIAFEAHQRYFPRCPFVVGYNVGNVPIKDMGYAVNKDNCGCHSATGGGLTTKPRIYVKPKNAKFASLESRKASFTKSQFSPISTNSLADAGFYFVGCEDFVKCFHCGGGLWEWLPGEDPWEQHRKWFPTCHFVCSNNRK